MSARRDNKVEKQPGEGVSATAAVTPSATPAGVILSDDVTAGGVPSGGVSGVTAGDVTAEGVTAVGATAGGVTAGGVTAGGVTAGEVTAGGVGDKENIKPASNSGSLHQVG